MGPIGIFDSGYGGLTVYKEIEKKFPLYDYVYLGDNARAPYGNRSLDTIYQYTYECVEYLFNTYSCPVIILACNTASAKALRQIQQNDLAKFGVEKRVLGIIRPTAEAIGSHLHNPYVGIMATQATVDSGSYLEEINKFFPDVEVFQQACPNWVPFIERGEFNSPELRAYVKTRVEELLLQCSDLRTIILACTHYPLIRSLIQEFTGPEVELLGQGELVAESLLDYLTRHPEMDQLCLKDSNRSFLTTGNSEIFQQKSSLFLENQILSHKIQLNINEI